MTTLPLQFSARPVGLAASLPRGRLLLALAVVAVVDVVLLVRRALVDVVSPYDEGYHLSYVQYAYEWSVPRVGEPMQRWSEEAYACYPTFPYGSVTSVPCGVDGESGLYPEAGRNSAAGWPPGYYLIAAQVVRVLSLFTSLDPLHAARIASCLLWAAGCVLVAFLVAGASRSPVLAVSVGVMGTAMPIAWAIGSYVTPYSLAMLMGGALVLALRWWVGPTATVVGSAALAVGLGALVGLTIPHGVVAVAATCVALAAAAMHRRPWDRRIMISAIVLGITNIIVLFGWRLLVAARRVGDTAPQPSNPPEGIGAAFRDNWDLFFPRMNSEVAFLTAEQAFFAKLVAYACIAFFGYWILRGGMAPQRAVALGVLVAAPAFGVIFALQFNFPVPPRYGSTLIGLLLFLLSVPNLARWLRGVLAASAAALVVVTWLSVGSYLVAVPG